MDFWPTPKPALLAAITILTDGFVNTDVWVSTKLPARSRPNRFLKVSRTGGGQQHPATDQARFLVECYGRTTGEAEWMINRAREVLRNSVGTTVQTRLVDTVAGTTIPDHDDDPAAAAVKVFVRGYGSETGVADYPNPEILDRERWQFVCALDIKSN